MFQNWLFPLVLLVVFEAIANVLAKEWSLNYSSYFLAFGSLTMYLVANAFWLFALKAGSGLARGGMIFSAASAVLAVGIGSLVYSESITQRQWVGILLGFVTLFLLGD